LQPICTTFGEFVDLIDVIMLAMFGFKIFIGFSRMKGVKSFSLIFPLGSKRPKKQCHALRRWFVIVCIENVRVYTSFEGQRGQ